MQKCTERLAEWCECTTINRILYNLLSEIFRSFYIFNILQRISNDGTKKDGGKCSSNSRFRKFTVELRHFGFVASCVFVRRKLKFQKISCQMYFHPLNIVCS